MSGFIKPIIGGRIKNEGSKKMIVSSFRDSKILSTYDGIVTQVDPNVCNGFVQIEHDINDVAYFSNFCNVGRIMVGRRLEVKQGDTIGYLGDEDLEYTIVDNNDDKQSLVNFFRKEDKTNNHPKEVEKDNTKTNTETNINNLKISDPKLPQDTYVDRLNSREVGLHSLMKNALVAPFHITDFLEKKRLKRVEVQKLKKEKEKQEKELEKQRKKEEEKQRKELEQQQKEDEKLQKVNEEINRIKELLK
jgi:hypothetical protein